MKTILIADINKRLLEDIENRVFIQDPGDVDIYTTDNIDGLQDEIGKTGAGELVISASLLRNLPSWNGLGVPVRCYASGQKDLDYAIQAGVPCMGVLDTSDKILDAVISGKAEDPGKFAAPGGASADRNAAAGPGAGQGNTPRPSGNAQAGQGDGYGGNAPRYPRPVQDGRNQGGSPGDSAAQGQAWGQADPAYQGWQNGSAAGNRADPWQERKMENTYAGQYQGMYQNQYQGNEAPGASQGWQNGGNAWNRNGQPYNYGGQGGYYPQDYMGTGSQGYQGNQQYDPRDRAGQGYYQNPADAGSQAYGRDAGGGNYRMQDGYVAPGPGFMGGQPYSQEAYMAVEKDMGNIQPPTKVITVYSAKGGVGKTTIACELATYLALTRHGKDNLKVCIADFNIDFGDVIATLPYDPEKVNMSLWAADIRNRLASGEPPESIRYTEAEITGKWLQRNERDGLYALIAPLTNEDSYEITETEQQVMLDNLIRNGGFDYLVCDTGNNTRDSSFLCISSADIILLVVTQNVATANSNAGILNTFGTLGINLDKVRIVINQVKPAKQVSVSAVELEEVFINPNTGQPYPCVAQIRDSNDVVSAGNMRDPLVYRSGHDYTRNIGQIASGIIGDTFTLEAPKKRRLFGFRRRK